MRVYSLFLVLLFAIIGFCQTYSTLDSGLIVYYPFDGNALDEGPNNLNGIVKNGASLDYGVNNLPNSSYRFDGVNDYVLIKGLGSYFPEKEATVSFWAQADRKKSHNVYYVDPDNQTNRLSGEVMYNHNGSNVCFFDHGNKNSGRLSHSLSFDSAWHHYVFVHSSKSNKMELYIDNKLVETRNSSGIFTQSSNVDLWIGGGLYLGVHGLFFDGRIDDFRIYGRTLNSLGVDSLYKYLEPKKDLNDGLIAYFPFCGDTKDYSKSKNHAIAKNGAKLSADKDGKFNSAFSFDGIDDYLLVNNISSYYPEEEATVSFWAKANRLKSHNVYYLNPDNKGYRLSGEVMYNHNGTNICFFDHGNISTGRLSHTLPFSNKWHHYTFTHSKKNNVMQLYIDKVLVKTVKSSGSFAQQNGIDLWIGGGLYQGVHGLFFDGFIDEFRIYERVLDSKEIDQLYDVQNQCSKASTINLTKEVEFKLYPTLGSGEYFIETQNSDSWVIDVFDARGSSIPFKLFKTNKGYELNLKSHPNGVYFVKLFNSTYSQTRKIILAQ